MKRPLFILLLSSLFIFSLKAFSSPLKLGEPPSHLILSGKEGEVVAPKGPWDSHTITKSNKVSLLFYVDPDKKDINEELEKKLWDKNYPLDKFQSIAIINMEATIIPNFLLNSALKSKQEDFPKTIYVKDYAKKLVSDWGAADNNYQVLLFDKNGNLIYLKSGEFSSEEVSSLISLIDKKIIS